MANITISYTTSSVTFDSKNFTLTGSNTLAVYNTRNITSLKALTGHTPNDMVYVAGYHTPGDGGGGFFYLDNTGKVGFEDSGVIEAEWPIGSNYPRVRVHKPTGATGTSTTMNIQVLVMGIGGAK